MIGSGGEDAVDSDKNEDILQAIFSELMVKWYHQEESSTVDEERDKKCRL